MDGGEAALVAAGHDVVAIPEGHLCCGSAGSYSLLQPEIAGELRARKLANAATLAPDVVVSGNIGCLDHLSGPDAPPLVHLAELIDWSEGGPVPAAIARGWRAEPSRATILAHALRDCICASSCAVGHRRRGAAPAIARAGEPAARKALDTLFAALAKAGSDEEAKPIEEQILADLPAIGKPQHRSSDEPGGRCAEAPATSPPPRSCSSRSRPSRRTMPRAGTSARASKRRPATIRPRW